MSPQWRCAREEHARTDRQRRRYTRRPGQSPVTFAVIERWRGVPDNGAPELLDRSMSYVRFLAMIAASTVAMFVLMYFNTYRFDHVFFSQTRLWMAVVMGATMAVVMLGFMLGMYRNRNANIAIFCGSVLLFCAALWLVRSQATVDDVSYMQAMIPHHSIAIMTSERAHIRDPRVRKLADGIIEAQVREIGEMKALITELERTPPPQGAPDLLSYRKRGAPPPPQ
jgi:DUF305 family protein family protein